VESFAGRRSIGGIAERADPMPRRDLALHMLWKNLLNMIWGREVTGR
jgi:hypothetical protein